MLLQTVTSTVIVSDVARETRPLPRQAYPSAVTDFLGGHELPRPTIESCSCYQGELVLALPLHPLISAVHLAFARHYPLILSPDTIWLTIVKGLAIHVNLNADRLRGCFVQHDGKHKICVRRDDFLKGSPENPWPDVFAAFSQQVRGYLRNDAYELIVCDFSTSGPVERVASEIGLLDVVQSYFEYRLVTFCGIPEIRLFGTVEDWRKILDRVSGLRRFGLGWWADSLGPVLEQFVAAVQGKVDQSFWERIYNSRGSRGSGDALPTVSGWVKLFYPYLLDSCGGYVCSPSAESNETNWSTGKEPAVLGGQPRIWMFPRHPAIAPFRWLYLQTVFEMEFVGGLIGVAQDPETLALRPEIGWAVRDRMASRRESLPDEDGLIRIARLQRKEQPSKSLKSPVD